jgi:hypothetical protein
MIITDGTRSKLCYWFGGKYLSMSADGFLTAEGFELDKDYHPTHWVLLPDPPK